MAALQRDVAHALARRTPYSSTTMASMGTSRVNYHFSNLCGTVYRQGNLVYSPDGNTLYSAVGNRVACFDLVRARSFTFPFEARRNIAHLALSPDGVILLTVDDEGHLLMANVVRRVVVGVVRRAHVGAAPIAQHVERDAAAAVGRGDARRGARVRLGVRRGVVRAAGRRAAARGRLVSARVPLR